MKRVPLPAAALPRLPANANQLAGRMMRGPYMLATGLTHRVTRGILLGLLGLVVLGRTPLGAHPISLTSGQAVVSTDAVRVKLEVLAEDFMMFYGLTPNENNRIPVGEILAAMQRHQRFLLQDFTIRDADGERLGGKVVNMVAPELKRDGIEIGDLMEYAFIYELQYSLPAPPTHLTFGQSFGRTNIPVPAVLELEVVQQGLSAPDKVVLTNEGNVETFEFQWRKQTGPSDETPRQAWERQRQERREHQLGISSYGAVYTFIYRAYA